MQCTAMGVPGPLHQRGLPAAAPPPYSWRPPQHTTYTGCNDLLDHLVGAGEQRRRHGACDQHSSTPKLSCASGSQARAVAGSVGLNGAALGCIYFAECEVAYTPSRFPL